LQIAIFDGITLFATIRLLQPTTHDRLKYIKAIYRTGSIMVLSIIVIRLVEQGSPGSGRRFSGRLVAVEAAGDSKSATDTHITTG